MWSYLEKLYNQDNTTKRVQLNYELENFSQERLSIEDNYYDF